MKEWSKRIVSAFTAFALSFSAFALPVQAQEVDDKHIYYEIIVDNDTTNPIEAYDKAYPGKLVEVAANDQDAQEDPDSQQESEYVPTWEVTLPTKTDVKKWMKDKNIDPDKHDMEEEVFKSLTDEYDLGKKVTFKDGQDLVLRVYVFTEVTVTYKDGDDGTVIGTELVEVGKKAQQPEDPIKEGKDFDAWYSDKKMTQKFDFDKAVNDDIDVYVKWKAKAYSISYDYQGGTVSQDNPTTYNEKTASTKLNNPTLKGYQFIGWTGSNGMTPEKDVEIPGEYTGDLEFVANYQPNTYTIHFDGVQGVDDIAAVYDQDVALPGAQSASQTISVSFDAAGGQHVETITSPRYVSGWKLGDTVYEAGQAVNNLTSENNKTVTLSVVWDQDGAQVTLPSTTYGDKILEGWYADGQYSTKVGDPGQVIEVKENIKLYAKWADKVYTITYDYQGGSVVGGQENPTSYNKKSASITLINPTLEGYTFTGWSGTGLKGESNTKVTIPTGSKGDRQYTAHFKPNTYTIHFEGSKSELKDIKAEYNQDVTLPDAQKVSQPIKVSFETFGAEKVETVTITRNLTGWQYGESVFAPGQAVRNLTTKNGETVTLKAVWDDAGTAITLPSAGNGNQVLEGWYYDAQWKNKAGNPGESITVKEDTKLYAKWKTVGFTVKGDGSVWTKGSKKPLEFTIHSDADDENLYSHFTGLYNNTNKLNSKAFTSKKGSVQLSINPDFLEILSAGKHTFTATFDDGRKVDLHFTIEKAKAKPSEKTDGQKTGVSTMMPVYIGALTAAILAILVLKLRKREG